MNCRDFERDCADWIKGRLTDSQSDLMAMHESSCSNCAATARAERSILAAVRRTPEPAVPGDLWPQVLSRLERGQFGHETTPARVYPWRRLSWAMAAAAAGFLAYVAWHPVQPERTALVKPEEERRVVEMMAASEAGRYVEASSETFEVSDEFRAQRYLLVGNGD
jgi:anti-sigma factor RsiW